ncbi:sporulation histidine kinase inhibitor Sda [Lentibacillus sp. CBA3610]|nr:sporulation histidine kinase inhibitor Sda [Lentibacillus sp. CBA3610]QKY69418.1 sporulation histidine kinase inhibitor Sda [Lentibacillus sp. CBA3610]
MKRASDETLIRAYNQALRLNLEENFIVLLKEELVRRNLLDQIEEDNRH